MHCSPSQQHHLANIAVEHFAEGLLTFDDLVATGRASLLSPLELNRRILLKGKVKQSKSKKDRQRSPQRGREASWFWRGTSTPLNRSSGRHSTSRDSTPEGDPSVFERSMSTVEMFSERSMSVSSERSNSLQDLLTPSCKKEAKAAAQKRIRKRMNKPSREADSFYASNITLRSVPAKSFFAGEPHDSALPITSIAEDRLLLAIGLPRDERELIEGLRDLRHAALDGAAERGELSLTQSQLSARAIVRLAANPPPAVGSLQRRTAGWLLRPFPLGARFSGKNMSPLPGWLTGSQSVALNMSNNDVPIQLHFALFNGSPGFILKPLEMRDAPEAALSSSIPEPRTPVGPIARWASERISLERPSTPGHVAEQETRTDYWPPSREHLHCASIRLCSLHGLPKRGEQRPSLVGCRARAHSYHPELSGTSAPPNSLEPTTLAVSLALHPIGGFCGIGSSLPLPQAVDTELTTATVKRNGLNAAFNKTVYCVAAEAHAVFLRVSVSDVEKEVAYEVLVLGRLKCGYRVLRLRSPLGTRIELCYLLVHTCVGREPNIWQSSRQLRLLALRNADEFERLKAELRNLRGRSGLGLYDNGESGRAPSTRLSAGREPSTRLSAGGELRTRE
mmetsp:Transcript_9588/g.28380  ORF Transcript_9588/g.28380 Transcript_9588/m.28380 type:complete len:621 (-) Transcript_9588:554-2416(-)